MRDINYSSWSDEELRSALIADDDDVCAILEAAKRFAKQEPEDDSEKRHEFDIAMTCPECGHEWDEPVDFADYEDQR
jgi:hypothetical protein